MTSNVTIVDTADTYGWDTVFGIHIKDVNAAISKQGTSPKTFQISDPDDGVSGEGNFGVWQLTTGGDGDLINISIPVTVLNIKLPGTETETLQNISLQATVRLNFLHEKTEQGEAVQQGKLVVKLTATDNEKVVSVSSVDYGDVQPGFMAKAVTRTLMEMWLNANLADFNHVFATVDLNELADKAHFQWLKPTDVAYAYTDLGTNDDGVLAVLCMTGGRSSAGLIQQVTTKIIPDGQRSGFLVSAPRLLDQILLPAMPQVFAGSKLSDYKISESGDSILNAHEGINFTAKDDKGNTHHVQVQKISVQINAQELIMDVLTKTEVSPGVTAYCHTLQNLAVELVARKSGNGEQTLNFKQTHSPEPKHWIETSEAIKITEAILGTVALVVAAIAIIVTDGAALLVIAAIIGLVSGIMMVTTTIIEMVNNNDAPAIGDMVLNATAPIKWSEASHYILTWAGLNGSLQFGGNPQFATS